jgi:hypothetical protein
MNSLQFLVLFGCLLSGAVAFSPHRGRAKVPMPANVRRGRVIPLRTRSPPLSSGNDNAGMISAGASLVSAITGLSAFFKAALDRLPTDLPGITFESPRPPEKYYASRPALEKKILSIYESYFPENYDSFFIVAGSKGAGKTTVIERVLNKKKGVLRLDISEADTAKTILSNILFRSGEVVDTGNLDINILAPGFWAAADAIGRRITVVLEVERGTASNSVLYAVKSAAKKLARFANVIVVLSEANAALMFGDDERHEFIWVDGMEPAEATECAQKVFPGINVGDLGLFIDKVTYY